MRSLIVAALACFAAGPVLAQHEGHGAAPAEEVMEAPDWPTGPEDEAPPAMDWPTELPAGEPAATGHEGMDHSGMDHSGMDHSGMDHGPVGDAPPPPPPADHAADAVFGPAAMGPARDILFREHGGGRVGMVLLDRAEWRGGDGANGYAWEAEAWYGTDIHRGVLKTEGEGADGHGVEAAEAQLLYARAVSPYFDLLAGVRQDLQPGSRRTWAVAGFQGLAPYWIETEGAVFLSGEGEVTARFEAETDWRLSQRLILQPSVEVELSGSDTPELGLGSGLVSAEAGLRLRYEIRREFAPYVGVTWERRFGGSADYARAAGEDIDEARVVAGLRAWF